MVDVGQLAAAIGSTSAAGSGSGTIRNPVGEFADDISASTHAGLIVVRARVSNRKSMSAAECTHVTPREDERLAPAQLRDDHQFEVSDHPILEFH